jgi:VWFA-related protein
MNERLHDSARKSGALLSYLLTAVLASPVLAQEPPEQSFEEIVDVSLINLEVWVSDQDGDPVFGLTADDFDVAHDDQQVAISHFTEFRDNVPVGPAGDDQEGHSRSLPPHLAVVFDLDRLTPTSQKQLAAAVRRVLADELIPPERVLILGSQIFLNVETPFGSSASEIEAALERLEKRESSSTDTGSSVKQIVQALQSVWTDLNATTGNTSIRTRVNQITGPSVSQRSGLLAGSGETPAPGAPGSTQACDDFVDRAKPLVAAWGNRELQQIDRSLSRLTDVSSFLSGLEGPKILLYVSDGLSLSPGFEAASFVRGLCPIFQTDLEIDALPHEIENSFLNLTRRLGANQITLHAIQGAGVLDSVTGSTGQASSDTRGFRGFRQGHSTTTRQALGLLSEQTGGRLIPTGSDLETALELIARDMGSYYSIAYSPPIDGSRRDHTIQLQTADDSLAIRYRRSYTDKTADQWLTERLESALYLGMVANPLDIRLGAGPIQASDGDLFTVPLHISIPVEELTFLEISDKPVAEVAIKIMTLNTSSRTLTLTERNLTLTRPTGDAANRMDVQVNLEVEAGIQAVAIGIRDHQSGAASFVSTTMQIGEPDKAS